MRSRWQILYGIWSTGFYGCKGLRSSSVGHDKVAAVVLGVYDGSVQRYRSSARVGHLGLVPVVGQQAVGEDKPAFLIALDVVGPLVQPAFGLGNLHRLLLLVLSHDGGMLQRRLLWRRKLF